MTDSVYETAAFRAELGPLPPPHAEKIPETGDQADVFGGIR